MNKVWLVTGSASGLGRNIAEAVLESGDRLVATARDTKRLGDLVKKYGDRVRAVPKRTVACRDKRVLRNSSPCESDPRTQSKTASGSSTSASPGSHDRRHSPVRDTGLARAGGRHAPPAGAPVTRTWDKNGHAGRA
jgi:hypothetical protein